MSALPTRAFREARAEDAAALRDLEREANLVGLAHVFASTEHPFPEEEVLERWRGVLADAAVTVRVVDGPGRGAGLDCFVAHDDTTLRHLAVHPRRWGTGLGRAGVELAAASIRAGGRRPRLWCLAANERALGLYTRLGWEPSGVQRPSEWAPHPVELELVLRGSGRG